MSQNRAVPSSPVSPAPPVASPASPSPAAVDVAAAIVATAPVMSYTVVFSRPAERPASAAGPARRSDRETLAQAAVIGGWRRADGTVMPLLSSGFAVARTGRSMTVYMPSGGGGFYKHIEPKRVLLARPIVVNGKPVTHHDDPDGVEALDVLSDAILTAWGDANESGTTAWETPIPFTL